MDGTRQFVHPCTQFRNGNVQRAGQVAQIEFLTRPHIQQHHAAALFQQLLDSQAFQSIAALQAVVDHAVHLAALVVGIVAERGQQVAQRTLTTAVEDALAIASGLNQAGTAQLLQMLGGIGYRQPGQFGQALHGALALGDVLQQGQAMGMAERAGDLGQGFQR